MPYTVPASFDKFLGNISLTGNHEETATARKERLVSLLGKEFQIVEAFPTGSLPRDTALRKYGDLDVMVALHYSKHIKGRMPSQVLKAVQECLSGYKTGVRRNGQAVTLHYDSWPNVDVVPVSQSVDGAGNVTHYNVPDMNNEVWLVSRPNKHSKELAGKSSTCGVGLKALIKMIKWWNHQHSEYLQSFHIEVMALKLSNAAISDYSWSVFDFFKSAAELITKPLKHGVDDVDGYLSPEDRQEAKQRLETAREKARDAWLLTYNGRDRHKDAIEIWGQIFGDEFPAYGS